LVGLDCSLEVGNCILQYLQLWRRLQWQQRRPQQGM
jgi:hypothetical protein